MDHIINLSIFVVGVAIVFYFVFKVLMRTCDKQDAAFTESMKDDLHAVFGGEPVVLGYEDAHPTIDAFLESLGANSLTTNRDGRRPKRVVVEGTDSPVPFIAAIIQSFRHQSGGATRYYFVYAQKGGNRLDPALLKQSECVTQIHEWVVASASEVMGGGYTQSPDRLRQLKSVLASVIAC